MQKAVDVSYPKDGIGSLFLHFLTFEMPLKENLMFFINLRSLDMTPEFQPSIVFEFIDNNMVDKVAGDGYVIWATKVCQGIRFAATGG